MERIANNLIQFGSIEARFLMVGNVIERKGGMFKIATPFMVNATDANRITFGVINETGGIQAVTMHRNLEVPLFDEVTDQEMAAALGQ